MAPLPMPERADAADASRLVELSVRRGWPLASLRKAPFEDRHAVLAGLFMRRRGRGTRRTPRRSSSPEPGVSSPERLKN